MALILLGILSIKLFGESSPETMCLMYFGFLLFCFGMLIKGITMLKEKDLLLSESARKVDRVIIYLRIFIVSVSISIASILRITKLLPLNRSTL